MNTPAPRPSDENLARRELRGWIEFGCWTTLALAPFLYWVNGPAVSRDQFVVQTIVVVVAAVGAGVCRNLAHHGKRAGRE